MSDHLVCTCCNNSITRTLWNNLFRRAYAWRLKLEAGAVTAVICPACQKFATT